MKSKHPGDVIWSQSLSCSGWSCSIEFPPIHLSNSLARVLFAYGGGLLLQQGYDPDVLASLYVIHLKLMVTWADIASSTPPPPHLITTAGQVFSKGLDGADLVVLDQLRQAAVRLTVS